MSMVPVGPYVWTVAINGLYSFSALHVIEQKWPLVTFLTLIAFRQRKYALCISAVKWFWGFKEQQITFREISVKSGIFAKNRREIWHFPPWNKLGSNHRLAICSRSGGSMSCRLSIVTTVLCARVWLQFAMQILTGGFCPPKCGTRSCTGSSMVPLYRVLRSSYGLLIVTIWLEILPPKLGIGEVLWGRRWYHWIGRCWVPIGCL